MNEIILTGLIAMFGLAAVLVVVGSVRLAVAFADRSRKGSYRGKR